jgi:hypothetical protein
MAVPPLPDACAKVRRGDGFRRDAFGGLVTLDHLGLNPIVRLLWILRELVALRGELGLDFADATSDAIVCGTAIRQ